MSSKQKEREILSFIDSYNIGKKVEKLQKDSDVIELSTKTSNSNYHPSNLPKVALSYISHIIDTKPTLIYRLIFLIIGGYMLYPYLLILWNWSPYFLVLYEIYKITPFTTLLQLKQIITDILVK